MMELNPGLHYLVDRERRADAMRDAERWRQIKSLKKHSESPGWAQRLALSLRGLVTVRLDGQAAARRPAPRQPASSSTR